MLRVLHRREFITRVSVWLRTGCALACLSLGTLAFATPQVTITPTAHDFGLQLVDTRSEPFTGLLTNTGTGPMTLDRFTVSNFRQSHGGWEQTGTCRNGLVLDAGASCTFVVTFTPGSLGDHFGSYCIVVPEAQYFDCFSELRLRGTGVQQAPFVYLRTGTPPGTGPGHLEMGRADLGVAGPAHYVELQNLGLANLIVTGWEITGDNPSDFILGSLCGAGTSLPVTATCQVDVRFRPTATGKRVAWLTVHSNGVAPYPAVQLTGTNTGIYSRRAHWISGRRAPGRRSSDA